MTQDILIEKYPKLFRQKHLTEFESCMHWGLQCDSGWFKIIDMACKAIQGKSIHLKRDFKYITHKPIVEFTQIKEKFGQLVIDFNIEPIPEEFINDTTIDQTSLQKSYDRIKYEIYGIIDLAELIASETCEICSQEGILHSRNYWVKTLCNKCAESNNYEKQEKY